MDNVTPIHKDEVRPSGGRRRDNVEQLTVDNAWMNPLRRIHANEVPHPSLPSNSPCTNYFILRLKLITLESLHSCHD